MRSVYFLHSIASQLQSIKSLLLYLLPVNEQSKELLYKYDDMAEEIAEAVAEINETERKKR